MVRCATVENGKRCGLAKGHEGDCNMPKPAPKPRKSAKKSK